MKKAIGTLHKILLTTIYPIARIMLRRENGHE